MYYYFLYDEDEDDDEDGIVDGVMLDDGFRFMFIFIDGFVGIGLW